MCVALPGSTEVFEKSDPRTSHEIRFELLSAAEPQPNLDAVSTPTRRILTASNFVTGRCDKAAAGRRTP